MTSSNVIEYIIFDKELNEVGRHRQNIMCHTNNDGLEKFRPFSDFTILPHGYDENEEHWKGNNENLQDWLSKNKATVTNKKFNTGDIIDVKKKGKCKVVKRYEIGERRKIDKMNWLPVYEVKTESGDIMIIDQNEIKPQL